MFSIASLNNIFLSLLPFIIEFILFGLIILFSCMYLFNVNQTVSNDRFLIEFILLFFTLVFIILLYISITDIHLFYNTSRLYTIENNNFLVKIFILLQFNILCIL
jgi:hypothetical protein